MGENQPEGSSGQNRAVELQMLNAIFDEPSVIHEAEDAVLELEREVYAHSLGLIRKIGEAAVNGAPDAEVVEIVAALKENFESSLMEMLQTDAEFRKTLEITRERTHEIRGGKVIGRIIGGDAEPIVAMLKNGAEKSAQDAKIDPRKCTQANRDAADVRNAEAVDAMPVGTLRMTLSMDPKEAMARDPQFWHELGYREGLAFLQCYYKVDEDTLVTFAYSTDYSDLAKWRKFWAECGGAIPADAPTDTWLDCAITAPCKNIDEARARVEAVRSGYYQKYSLLRPMHSVDEFKAANQKVIDDTFNSLYLPMTTAHYNGRMNGTMHGIVGKLLQNTAAFKPEALAQLKHLYTVQTLDDNGTRFLENIIRYGTVEYLRDGLQTFKGGRRGTVEQFFAPLGVQLGQHIIASIADGVVRGTIANRSYGGCTSEFNMGADKKPKKDGDKNSERDPQDAYGGIGGEAELDGDQICDIRTENCYCCSFNADGTKRETKLTVTARYTKHGTLECKRVGCGAWIAKDGTSEKGHIARRGEALERVQARSVSAVEPQMAVVANQANDVFEAEARAKVDTALAHTVRDGYNDEAVAGDEWLFGGGDTLVEANRIEPKHQGALPVSAPAHRAKSQFALAV